MAGDWLRLGRGTGAWHVASELTGLLLDEHGLRLEEWRRRGCAAIVKTGPHRTVYRIELPQDAFYIKHYRTEGWRSRLRSVFGCKAEMERRAAARIDAAGVAAPEIVAVGRERAGWMGGDSYLVSRAIEKVVPLDEFFDGEFTQAGERQQAGIRQQVARRLGELVGRLHAAGIVHHDLHAGNIVARFDPDGDVTLFLIDLHPISFQRRLSARQRRHNLAIFNRFFFTRATRSDRLRFYLAYRDERRAAEGNLPVGSAAKEIEQYCRKEIHHAWSRQDQKWSRGNRRVLIADTDGVRCRGIAELGRELLERLRDRPEELFGDDCVIQWKQSLADERSAAIRLSIGGREQQCLCRYRMRPADKRPSTFFGTPGKGNVATPVRRAWEMGHALWRRGIPTPRPLLFVERELDGRTQQYLVVELIEDAVDLAEFVEHQLPKLSPAERTEWTTRDVSQLANHLRWIDECGFEHSHLDAHNILVGGNEAGRRFWFIRPEQICRRKWLRPRGSSAGLSHFLKSANGAAR